MGELKNGGFVLYEPEQDARYHKSYKARYELLKDGLKKEYITKEDALECFDEFLLGGDEEEKEKYLKELKQL